jgi:hypothetical protein
MSRNEEFAAGGTGSAPKFVKRGNGAAIHIAKDYHDADGAVSWTAALCDGWGASANRRVTPVNAEAPTCKTCIRNSGSSQ